MREHEYPNACIKSTSRRSFLKVLTVSAVVTSPIPHAANAALGEGLGERIRDYQQARRSFERVCDSFDGDILVSGTAAREQWTDAHRACESALKKLTDFISSLDQV